MIEEPVTVDTPQHYFMVGIKIDLAGRTSMPRLYACGETSCNKVHGANRLASNSLLESLVFARRAADDIAFSQHEVPQAKDYDVDMSRYRDVEKTMAQYRRHVLREIEKERKNHE